MTDIYWIKDISLGSFINYKFTTIIIIVAVFVYFILTIINKKVKNKTNDKRISQEKNLENKIDIQKLLNYLEKNYKDLKQDYFYHKLDYIIRILIKNLYKLDINSLSYDELKKSNIPSDLKKIIKEIYFREYNHKITDNTEIRQKYIQIIKNLA